MSEGGNAPASCASCGVALAEPSPAGRCPACDARKGDAEPTATAGAATRPRAGRPEHRATELVAGRYRLGRRLGRGAFGQVHEAEDLLLGRIVAIKLLDLEVEATDFEREGRALARL